MRYFGGLTAEEIATVLHISPQSVQRDWSLAKSWLVREMSREESHGGVNVGLPLSRFITPRSNESPASGARGCIKFAVMIRHCWRKSSRCSPAPTQAYRILAHDRRCQGFGIGSVRPPKCPPPAWRHKRRGRTCAGVTSSGLALDDWQLSNSASLG